MIKTAIFDIDGTLLDSMPVWNNLGERFLRGHGITARAGLSEALRTLSFHEGAEFLRREYLPELSAEQVLAEVNEMIARFYLHEVQPKAGAMELLSALSSRGIRLAIATAGNAALSSAALKRLGLFRYFSSFCTCEQFGGKNEPAVFLAAAGECPPEQAVVFEDSLHALITAKRAGFVTAAVFDPSEPNQAELRKTADYYANDLAGFAECHCRQDE